MPVLMVALLALAAFGAIGALLAAAVILEQRSHTKESIHIGSMIASRHR
jgi:hypothetical protein